MRFLLVAAALLIATQAQAFDCNKTYGAEHGAGIPDLRPGAKVPLVCDAKAEARACKKYYWQALQNDTHHRLGSAADPVQAAACAASFRP